MSARAALITGGSGGIGLEIARVLGSEGYAMTISGRRADKLEGAVGVLRSEGHEVHGVAADVADQAQLESLAAAHAERFGRLDVLVNNAGVGAGAPFGEAQLRHLDLQIAVNLRSVFVLTRACLDLLLAAGAEHREALIVNVASIAAKHGQPGLSAYSATKAGVVGLTQSLQAELSQKGVRATALCPGYVATTMTDWLEDRSKDEMIQPTDVAESVRFLLRTSPACLVPEIQFLRPGDALRI